MVDVIINGRLWQELIDVDELRALWPISRCRWGKTRELRDVEGI